MGVTEAEKITYVMRMIYVSEHVIETSCKKLNTFTIVHMLRSLRRVLS